MYKNLLLLHQLEKEDSPEVGFKAARLGELSRQGLKTPSGFVIASEAFFDLLKNNNLYEKFESLFKSLDFHHHHELESASLIFKKALLASQLPTDLEEKLKSVFSSFSPVSSQFFLSLSTNNEAVASFFEEKEKFFTARSLNVFIKELKSSWADVFDPKVIFLAKSKEVDFATLTPSLVFQALAAADASGTIKTRQTSLGNLVSLTALWGLDTDLHKRVDEADTYLVDKKTLAIVRKTIGQQKIQLIPVRDSVKKLPVPLVFSSQQKLEDRLIQKLCKDAVKIENHFLSPQKIHWFLVDDNLMIDSTQPLEETEKINFNSARLLLENSLQVLAKGRGLYPGIATGPIKFLSSKLTSTKPNLSKVKNGDIVFLKEYSNKYSPLLRKAAGLVVSKLPEKAFSASLRNLGKPTLVGEVAENYAGQVVTLDGGEGKVLKGAWARESRRSLPTRAQTVPEHRRLTKIFVSTGEPQLAQELAQQNFDGVGLLRAEPIWTQIGTHPQLVLREKGEKKFVRALANQIGKLAAAFSPRPVIYRASEFTLEDLQALRGSPKEQASESSPQGAAYFLAHPEHFELELEAIKEVRNGLGFKNLWLAIPLVRSVEEMEKIKKQVSGIGLPRSGSFRLLMIAEVPANTVLIDQFLETGIDGLVVDVADLASLILGKTTSPGSKTSPAVLDSLARLIKETRKRKLFASAILQAGELNEEILETLVRAGVSAVSVPHPYLNQAASLLTKAEKKIVTGKN
ncbi:MAG: PEP/pyruvate-binding domain-containing protein [bacterium]|nr:PEP/pyruvate-binding domain-containing protein [bacterium]